MEDLDTYSLNQPIENKKEQSVHIMVLFGTKLSNFLG